MKNFMRNIRYPMWFTAILMASFAFIFSDYRAIFLTITIVEIVLGHIDCAINGGCDKDLPKILSHVAKNVGGIVKVINPVK